MKGVPSQPFTLGVIIYSTSTGSVVVFVRVSVMVAPVPLPAAFVIPATTALVHSNVAVVEELVAV